ncbi:hypothetical protein PCA31118_00759 [Pandoraea captiosa]|jgi:hypothetical protein|uniref:Uncharacterized protein n=1 Tax=Pandoraea captiosa TaxID=2508302 RepID=A0A5E4ZNG3_9BURK|nr:hypothetical protein [Pandoraea captiosa]VVE61783.1 hypothetical protein PCA31118_00759 [Pandoraea captiosa]
MRRLLGLLVFLAGGLGTEVVHPLQCDLVPASRRVLPEAERLRRRTHPARSGDGDGGDLAPQRASL